jgi:hypothetical protein
MDRRPIVLVTLALAAVAAWFGWWLISAIVGGLASAAVLVLRDQRSRTGCRREVERLE